MDDFIISQSFPVIVRPKKPDITFHDFLSQLKKHKAPIGDLLLERGALLFRGFKIHSADDFAKTIETLGLGEFVNYIGGDSPRTKVKEKVYTSTEAPPSFHLPLHQELSYVKHFPKHIYFFCEIEPRFKGETIIADARKVFNSLDPRVVDRFQRNGLTYISRYHYKNKVIKYLNHSHKSWCEVFETHDKNTVEKICNENEINLRWLANDWVEIKETRSALIEHPLTSEAVWFNQAHLFDFNPKLLGYLKYVGTKLFYIKRDTTLHEITFADGSPVSRADLYHILEVLHQNTVAEKWKKGDVMVLDNILSMHGRASFKGPRRILTALTK